MRPVPAKMETSKLDTQCANIGKYWLTLDVARLVALKFNKRWSTPEAEALGHPASRIPHADHDRLANSCHFGYAETAHHLCTGDDSFVWSIIDQGLHKSPTLLCCAWIVSNAKCIHNSWCHLLHRKPIVAFRAARV